MTGLNKTQRPHKPTREVPCEIGDLIRVTGVEGTGAEMIESLGILLEAENGLLKILTEYGDIGTVSLDCFDIEIVQRRKVDNLHHKLLPE